MMSKMLELEVCPSCESDDIGQIFEEWGYCLGVERYYRLYQCNECKKRFERPDRVLIEMNYDVVFDGIVCLYYAKL